MCDSVPKPFRDECFSGIGIDLPGHVAYDDQRIIEACDSLPNDEASELCLRESMHTISSLFKIEPCQMKAKLGEDVFFCPQ